MPWFEPRRGGRSPEDLIGALRAEGIRDERVYEAFRRVRREDFVPPEARPQAYVDEPIRIARGQVTSQPSLVARMVEALELGGDERVLEVGTGLGFQTALLARLAREVYSIERFPELAAQALGNLRSAWIEGVTVVVGDGTLGVPEHAPFDAIVVSAAAPKVPRALADQLAEGGRLVQPIGPGGAEVVTLYRKREGRLVKDAELTGAYFVRLVGEQGMRERGDA